MQIISVMSLKGGTGVTAQAFELIVQAKRENMRILAIDTSPARHLTTMLGPLRFNNIEEIYQLFRPLEEADWNSRYMPPHAIIGFTQRRRIFDVRLCDGSDGIAMMPDLLIEAKDAQYLGAALGDLKPHFDIVVADVQNKDQALMQAFYDVSDDVHVMERDENDPWPYIVGCDDFFIRQKAKRNVTFHMDRSKQNRSENDDWSRHVKELFASMLDRQIYVNMS